MVRTAPACYTLVMAETRTDILIVGAGIAGAATAYHLKRVADLDRTVAFYERLLPARLVDEVESCDAPLASREGFIRRSP